VDIGGGSGGVLAELLAVHPGMTGVLYDQPAVVADAADVLAPVAGRCRVESGDFFAGVPAGGDVYLLVNVIHDWADAPAARILGRVMERMNDSTRLLVVEGVPGVDGAVSRSGALDVHMMVVWGGRERSLAQWGDLLTPVGLRVRRRFAAGPRWILECARA
jgi:O-methyltransferase